MYMFVDTRDVVVIGHGFKYLRISKKPPTKLLIFGNDILTMFRTRL